MDPYSIEPVETTEQQQGFHALMRYLRVVNRHRMILFGLLAAGCFLAVVYYQRQPKKYESTAKLMVRQLTSDPTQDSMDAAESIVNSYRQLLLSDRVLVDTVKSMDVLPPELATTSDSAIWPAMLRSKILQVSFPDDENVIEISCRSRDPESTVRLIRTLTSTSESFMERFQQNDALETVKQLQAQRNEVEQRLFARERDVLEARKQCGDITVSESSDDSHPLVQRVTHLNSELTTIQSKRLELEALLSSVRSQVAAHADLSLALQKMVELVGPAATEKIPGTPRSLQLQLEKQEQILAEMETELAGLAPNYGSGHTDIQRRKLQIQVQQQRVAKARDAVQRLVSVGLRNQELGRWIVETLTAELAMTMQYERSLQGKYDQDEQKALQLSDKLANIRVAERDVETLRELHSSLLDRLNSINIEPGGGLFKVAPLTEPMIPEKPVAPVLVYTLAVFCFVSGGIGLAVIYVIDLLDDRLRSPEEVREELGLPVLSVIRRLPQEEVDQAKIYVHGFPQTPHAECFRTLKTSLTMSALDTKCLAITSTEASEGKTTTVVNLAASYAQTGQTTLLIDADMRRPGLSRLLEVRANGGLSEILRAESDIPTMCKERIVKTEVPDLEVLPCGPRILNAGMLLSMPSLADILDWAVSEYDQVIVDCPPTLPVSDAAIVGRFVDSMLFLMNPDKTHRRSVARAVDQLRSMGLKIAGIVANTSLSEERNSYGYQYGYGYGYTTDYSYGHDDEFDDEGDTGLLSSSGTEATEHVAATSEEQNADDQDFGRAA